MQLHDLSDVLAAPGPFVTVHIGAESAVEQAADRYDLAWRNVLKRLEDEGVPAPVREASRRRDLDTAVVYAGQSVGLVHSPRPAADVVAELAHGPALLRAAASG